MTATPPPKAAAELNNHPNAQRPGYKLTKLGWLPVEWEVVRLGQLLKSKKKITYGIVQPGEYISNGIPMIRSQDYTKNAWDLTTIMQVAPEIDAPYERSRVATGDILITVVGANVGKLSVVPKQLNGANISRSVARISIDGQRYDSTYVKGHLESGAIDKFLYKTTVGGAQPVINLSHLSNLNLPLPPLPEQTAIAGCLATWDRALATTRELLAALRERKKGLMQGLLTGERRLPGFASKAVAGETVGWQKVRLSSISSKIGNGLVYNIRSKGDKKISRIETIADGVINFGKVGFFKSEDAKTEYRLENGDILYSHINSVKHIGKVAFFNHDEELFHGMNLLRIQPEHKKVNWKFLYYWLASTLGRKWAWRLAKKAVNQASISSSEVKSIRLLLPPLPEQTAIAAVLTAADREIALYEQKLAALEEQKKGLMQQLLTGAKRLV